jgi:hypothetical protein
MAGVLEMKMLSDQEKYLHLERLIAKGTGRGLTQEEEAFLNWLVCWDMDMFNALKGILESMTDKQIATKLKQQNEIKKAIAVQQAALQDAEGAGDFALAAYVMKRLTELKRQLREV